MRRMVGASVVALALLGGNAAASHSDAGAIEMVRRDPRGDVGNRLDIVRVSFEGTAERAVIALRTDTRWGCKYVNRDLVHDGGVASLRWEVDTNRDPYTERTAFFSCARGEWALHWGKRTLPATRADRRSLAVVLPLDKLGLYGRRNVSFTALSFANGRFGDHLAVEETDVSPALKPWSR